jgi:hypothetical protein
VKLTLPENYDLELPAPELASSTRIAGAICLKLGAPKFFIVSRDGAPLAVRMMMPKAAIYKDGPALRRVCEIRGAGQRFHILPILDTQHSELLGYKKLRLRR